MYEAYHVGKFKSDARNGEVETVTTLLSIAPAKKPKMDGGLPLQEAVCLKGKMLYGILHYQPHPISLDIN
ncbi:hypothetical protein GDO78_004048 [Eleutherodactylus coqui]|uniref:Uncharacterized protein n=1 Tax=Eleutherodactylus coqui TaxID=57060 RepID=A0A8J6EPT6_ELECQ|nr:hypothetical protein GDO78_004048 [Eleutherodactylus coqui]